MSTLPISPRPNPSLGFFTLPVLVDLLAGICGRNALIPINLIGSKSGAMESVDGFVAALNTLKVDAPRWIDQHEIRPKILQSIVDEGLAVGWLTYEPHAVWVCPCGKTEVTDEAESLLVSDFAATTYVLVAGEIKCQLCEQMAVRMIGQRLLMTLPQLPKTAVKWQPSYCAREMGELLDKFSGRKISVSRKRETGLIAMIGSETIHLDPDLVWMVYPAMLERGRGQQIETLLVGHKTLKHTAYSLLCSSLLRTALPALVVSVPYLNVGQSPYLFSAAAARSAETLRCLLAVALGSRQKSVDLDSKWIYWIEHSIRVPRPEPVRLAKEPWQEVAEVCSQFSQQSMTVLLAKLRGRRLAELTNIERSVLRNILKP